MLYERKPKSFKTDFTAAGCFLEFAGKILVLKRQDNKIAPNTWCLPGGKINTSMNVKNEIIREIQEETQLKITSSNISLFKKVYIVLFKLSYPYYIFNSILEKSSKIKTNPREHKDFCWVTSKEALKMNLIEDLDKCIKLFYKL